MRTTTIGRVTNTVGARIHLAIDGHRALCGSGRGTITRPVPQHNIQHIQAKNLCRRCFTHANLDEARSAVAVNSHRFDTSEAETLAVLHDLIKTPAERASSDEFWAAFEAAHTVTQQPEPQPAEPYRPRGWGELRDAFADSHRRYMDMIRARRTGQQAELLPV